MLRNQLINTMRTVSGKLFDSDYKLSTPFRMLISGSSGTGKTTFIENLIQSSRIDKKFKNIYYVYPYELMEPPVDWDQKFTDINVEFMNELPDLKFFDTAKRDSLLVIDDLWVEACQNTSIVKSFKVFSRKMGISIIIVSQRFFSGGEAGREIRNNWYFLNFIEVNLKFFLVI